MAIVLNQTQEMLRDSALAFLRESAPIPTLRKLRDTRDDTGFSPALWREFAELGFAGVLIPEQYGGSELGVVEAGVLMEALGRTLAPTPFFSTALLGASLISRGGSAAQKAHFLPAIAAGRHLTALAIDEGAAHRPERQALAAVQQDGGFVLNGAKVFVIDGHIADTLIAVGRTSGNADDRDGVTLFLVPRGADGITVERTVMADARNAARVQFRDVRVAADAVLGEAGRGAAMLEHALDIARVALASELVGIADEAFARTLQYLKERKQFGKMLSTFQALQFKLADMLTDLTASRQMVRLAAHKLDQGHGEASPYCAMAKRFATDHCFTVCNEALQLHGGYGYLNDNPLERWVRDSRVHQILEGTNEIMRVITARRLLEQGGMLDRLL